MRLTDLIMTQGESMQYGVYLILLLALGAAEAIRPRMAGDGRRLRWPTNFGMTAVNIFAMGLLPTSLIGIAVWAERNGLGLLNWTGAGLTVTIFVTLLFRALLSYGTHVLMHKVPLLWRIHRVHHTDTRLDVSTTVRFHPFEFFVNLGLAAPFVILMGPSPWVLMLYEILDAGGNIVTHANVDLPNKLDQVIRPLFVTPNMHLIHHSSFQPETDSNYGAVFSVWDFVFGTHRWEATRPVGKMQIGLEEVRGRDAQGLLNLLASPFRNQLSGSWVADSGREPTTSEVSR